MQKDVYVTSLVRGGGSLIIQKSTQLLFQGIDGKRAYLADFRCSRVVKQVENCKFPVEFPLRGNQRRPGASFSRTVPRSASDARNWLAIRQTNGIFAVAGSVNRPLPGSGKCCCCRRGIRLSWPAIRKAVWRFASHQARSNRAMAGDWVESAIERMVVVIYGASCECIANSREAGQYRKSFVLDLPRKFRK